MAGKTIDMSKLRKTLRLYSQGRSKRFISNYLGLSRNTVKKYISRFESLRLTLDRLSELSDSELDALFLGTQQSEVSGRLQVLYDFFPYARKELLKPGVTRLLLWQEYIHLHPTGFSRSQFYHHLSGWSKCHVSKPVMRMVHKAGDKLFVDYAGKTLELVDPQTGEIRHVQFFAAILGASQLTYAQASFSQQKHDFIQSIENALHYIGGVPRAIVTDNLKSAVTKSSRYEPTLNETFLDFSEHYGTAILPARSYKPRDKALVEGVIKILYTRIFATLRNEVFFSLDTLNKVILGEIEKHNQTQFSRKSSNRRALFDELEADKLNPLPVKRYEIKQQAIVTVMQNAHVLLGQDKHYYSVPFIYIRKNGVVTFCRTVI